MPQVVPVKFPFASCDLWFDPQALDIVEADYAVCSTERGTEIGLVTADPFEVEQSELRAPLKPVVRIATDEDLDRADELARKGEAAMADFRELVRQNELDMKPVGVEYLFGGEKAVFYFAAEDRVDFRQLVKDLSARLHTRVDMRQIGVRDETRLIGGIAHCGQELCCTRFGGQFEPVSIRMAKEQDLPLNSTKISGVCGRLMCCLRYEFEAYKDFKSRAPKKTAVIDTPLGKARIQEFDTPREQLVLRLESGKIFRVDLSDMTCSDAARQRAEEQGCSCRPDCVTRDVLERLESPDIALALMELDRENGIDVGDGLSSDDRLVDAPRRRRSRERSDASASIKGKAQGQKGARSSASEGSDASTPARRKRKRSSGQGDAAKRTAAAAGTSQAQTTDAAPAPRRRRRHLSSEERDRAFLNAAAREGAKHSESEGDAADQAPSKSGSRTRRRHHAASSQKPDVPSVARQVAEGEVKVTRRRPGDGGGTRPAAPADSAGRAASDGEEASAKKRRRRSRRRKPGDGGGASAHPQDSAE